MKITNEERQILMKNYAEKIKSAAASLKDFISQDRPEPLEKALRLIGTSAIRIGELQEESAKETPTATTEETHD